ncbi:MAG TPA: hypothetical protein ENI87_06790 [bacterium]|nr:hypothetical protein [bacterium]
MGSNAAESTTATATTTSYAERNAAWLLAGLIVLAAVLRLPMLDRPVWFDEACMSSQRIGTVPQLLATLYKDIHPPLFVAFMHLWNGWFGDGEVMLRMPALLTGLFCIPLTWWTGQRLVGHTASMWAAALLALSPVHVWYCTEARLYTPMVMCTLLAFGTFDRLLADDERPRPWLWLLHLGNVAVMLALHYYLAVVVAALAGLAPVLARGFTGRARAILVTHGIGIVLLAGFLYVKQTLGQFETSQGYLRALTVPGLCDFLFGWAWTGNTLQSDPSPLLRGLGQSHYWLGVSLAVLGVIHIALHRRDRPRGVLVPFGLLLLPCFLLGCAWVGYGQTYLERTLIPALPFLLLLAGAGITFVPGRLADVVGGLATGLATLSVLALLTSFDSRWTVYKPHPDWRAAARYLGREIDTGNAGTPVFTSMPNPRSLSYYDPRIQDKKNLRVDVSPEQIGAKVGRFLGERMAKLARETFAEFAAHNRRLLADAKLIVRRSRPNPADLDLPDARPDGIVYLVRNQWHPHPSVDDSIERLLQHPDVETLHTERLQGVTVYKVRIHP